MPQHAFTPVRLDAVLKYMLENPSGSYEDCAKKLGVSYATVSSIARSDMFRARLQLERNELLQHTRAAVQAQATGVLQSALKIMNRRLQTEAVTERGLKDYADSALKIAGYGAPSREEVQRHVHQHVHITAEQLAAARAKIGQNSVPAKLPAAGQGAEEHSDNRRSSELDAELEPVQRLLGA